MRRGWEVLRGLVDQSQVFYNDTEDELALLEENPKSDAKKKALNTKPVINDWQEQEEVIREREVRPHTR
jgi:hypothetical protein